LQSNNSNSNSNSNKEEDDDDSSMAQQARLNFATLVAGELFAGQWGPHDGLRFNQASSSDANNNANANANANNNAPEGLHVDTNNDSTFRSVTVILYLNDVPPECGGATVFPLANAHHDDPALGAARRLLKDGLAHTRGAAGSKGVLESREADALLLERTVGLDLGTSCGLRVQPQAGRLCIFFSRTADGEVDARSWHGGERLVRGLGEETTEKRILTLFKEVYYGELRPDTFETETSFEAYLAPQIAEQRQALQVLAQSHASFFVPI